MLGLPKATELSRQLPKKAIYAKFNMNTAARDKFDADISRITIVNEVSPTTVAISAGEQVKAFYVLLVSLKRKEFDERIIGQLSRMIDQKMLFVLEHGEESSLAVYHNKVLNSEWTTRDALTISLTGLDLDTVWRNIIVQIGDVQIEEGNSLDDQIALDARRTKLQKEIDRIERLARMEQQPKKKFELVQLENNLKKQLEGLN